MLQMFPLIMATRTSIKHYHSDTKFMIYVLNRLKSQKENNEMIKDSIYLMFPQCKTEGNTVVIILNPNAF